ncbi:hypothetical protein JHD48_05790 [Sulfurimonas sp. SAG-AH-194-I05]|nr:hypothetical protein [Sulfurimonas sp. SAG-AH-194-I05]MDF1875237.1 hypothetical protein [Sulfurimonas sp. SAG-AH-194-I05]
MLKKVFIVCMAVFVSLSANSFERNMYLTGQIKVKGESGPNQSKYSATRAAQLVAQRNLLEVIGGLRLTSSSTLKDGILVDDVIETQLEGYLRGATVLEERYNPQDGSASVVMGIGYLGSVSNVLAKAQERGVLEKTLYKNERPAYYEVEELKKQIQPQADNTPDSVIVDVRGLEFEPAQINRIYFESKIVYDPLMVPAEIISQRGLAKYTTSLNRARAILETYNANNPLIIKATSVTNLASDVKISQEDAQALTRANKGNGFLEAAKVVFIVD